VKAAAVGQLGKAGPQMSLRRAQFLLFYTYLGFGTVLQVFPPLLASLSGSSESTMARPRW